MPERRLARDNCLRAVARVALREGTLLRRIVGDVVEVERVVRVLGEPVVERDAALSRDCAERLVCADMRLRDDVVVVETSDKAYGWTYRYSYYFR